MVAVLAAIQVILLTTVITILILAGGIGLFMLTMTLIGLGHQGLDLLAVGHLERDRRVWVGPLRDRPQDRLRGLCLDADKNPGLSFRAA